MPHAIDFEMESLVSADGTKIGYRKLGSGPGLILVHGGIQAAQNFMRLGKALSDKYTVYIPDRRGRGTSGVDAGMGLTAECGDIRSLVHETNAENLFGLSSGAIISLATAIAEPSLKKLALYEPPLPIEGVDQTEWNNKYEHEVEKANWGRAFLSVVKGTASSSALARIPGFILIPLLNLLIDRQEKRRKPGEASLKQLIRAFRYDQQIVLDAQNILEESRLIKSDVLLMGGSKSQAFLKMALDQLQAALPMATRKEFAGFGHIEADNSGRPQIIANELKRFFR
ncbi:MAG: alpha/beta fold hydrolase [Bacteroidota bacterium]|nr:alpha/beta fold hydrolase [Bacteroidota bacterium]